MQLTKTAYNKELLEKWKNEEITEERITTLLDQYVHSYADVITNKTQRVHFENYLMGLMSNLDRKSIEPIALSIAGDKGVRPLQQFITRSTFDDEAVLKEYQRAFGGATKSSNGMLSVDGSDFVKKGKNSVGVTRQYCGVLGKTENCQAGVFCAYAGDNGYGIVERELYLPKNWFDDAHAELREKCDIPKDKVFRTKNEIALELLRSAADSGNFNVKWIGCDAAFGCDHSFIDSLPKGTWYFAGIKSTELVFLARPERKVPEQQATGRPPKHGVPESEPVQVITIAEDESIPWENVALFEGSKGTVFADVKYLRCVSCRAATSYRQYPYPCDDIWLYIRRYENNDIKYFISNAPADIRVEELHEAATLRWPIEQCFEECKSYLGMGTLKGAHIRAFYATCFSS